MEKVLPDCIQPDLPGIIIISHGPLALAMVESAKMIGGRADNVAAFALGYNDSPEDFCESFMETYRAMPEGSILLVDLFGGTPSNQLLRFAAENELIIPAVAGVNLPLLLEAMMLRMDCYGEKLAAELTSIGRQGITCLTDNIKSLLED